MSFYSEMAATATELLAEFGAACTLKRQTTGTYNPGTGTTPVTTESLPTTAAVFAYPQRYIDGTLILEGDQQAFMVPAVAPKQGDVLAWQGRDWQVIAVKPLAPAGVHCLYEAQLRGQ